MNNFELAEKHWDTPIEAIEEGVKYSLTKILNNEQ